MSALDWLRTRRALSDELDAQADLINQQRAQLDDLAARLAESQASLVAALRRSEQQSQRMADIRSRLIELREQVADYEQGRVPITQPEPVRGGGVAIYPPYTRRQAEAIADHVADKRRENNA